LAKLPVPKAISLPLDNPVGAYFHAMHETGFYLNFIGYFQIVIGLLAFFNRTIVLSSILMMPVTVNIFLISVFLKLSGIPFITAAMVLGNIFIMIWHYENLTPILARSLPKNNNN
jgi:hypothetical protein